MRFALPWFQPLWWPTRRYVYACWLLPGLFRSSRTLRRWGWLSHTQYEHWQTYLLRVWRGEQQRLSQKSLDALAQCLRDGRLAAQPDHQQYFHDLLALHREGRYDVVLAQLYGDGTRPDQTQQEH